GVDTDEGDVATLLTDRLGRALVDRAADREEHVGTLVEQVLRDGLGLDAGGEAAGEGAGLRGLVPTDGLDGRTVHLVVVGDAVDETVHEDGDGVDLHATEGADDTGLAGGGRGVAGEERGLGRVEEDRLAVFGVVLTVEVAVEA